MVVNFNSIKIYNYFNFFGDYPNDKNMSWFCLHFYIK